MSQGKRKKVFLMANVTLLHEIELSHGWFASSQSNGDIVLHNFPSDASLEDFENIETTELHFSASEQAPLLRLLKLSEQESHVQDVLPRYIASKRLHGDVWVFLDEMGQLTIKSETVTQLSNLATRGLLNFFHRQEVQDAVRMGG
jgi:hypothetical protein